MRLEEISTQEEMAGQEWCWAALPNVIIVQILSYLSLPDRLKASAICHRWRGCLFQPQLCWTWPKLVLKLTQDGLPRTSFLVENIGQYVTDVVLDVDVADAKCIKETLRVLSILTQNRKLCKLSFRPTSCNIVWPASCESAAEVPGRYISTLSKVLGPARKLDHFALGCLQDFTDHVDIIIEDLAQNQGHTLKSLHIASLKEDPDNYVLIDIPVTTYDRFRTLKILNLDYDFLSDSLIKCFSEKGKAKLENIIINIHGINPAQEHVTNETWLQLRQHSPGVRVTLNLIHSIDIDQDLPFILTEDLPLGCFRSFFCGSPHPEALEFLSENLTETLETVCVMDGMKEDGQPHEIYTDIVDLPLGPLPGQNDYTTNPFIVLAWKCEKLKSFTLIGYCVDDYDLYGMSRLRPDLETVNIPSCCIRLFGDDEEDMYIPPTEDERMSWFATMFKHGEKKWKPLSNEELPAAIFDAEADAEEAYLPILLQDQVY